MQILSMSDSIIMMFSKVMELCYNFLTKDLADFAGGVFNSMRMVNIGFQAFSYAFLVLLTLWNMIRQSLSWEQLKRPEVLIKFFVRYIATTYVTLSSWNIVTGMMTIVGALITRAFTSAGFGGGNIWAGMATPSFTDSFTSLIGSALTLLTGGLNILPALIMYLLLFCVCGGGNPLCAACLREVARNAPGTNYSERLPLQTDSLRAAVLSPGKREQKDHYRVLKACKQKERKKQKC